MKFELKRIGVWSAIKVAFLLSLVLGFAMGILYALMIMMFLAAPMSQMPDDIPAMSGVFFGGIMLIFMPIFTAIFAAIFNTIAAALGAVIYNFVVRMIGGVEFEMSEVKAVTVQPVAVAPPPPPPPTPPYQPPPPPPPPTEPEGPIDSV